MCMVIYRNYAFEIGCLPLGAPYANCGNYTQPLGLHRLRYYFLFLFGQLKIGYKVAPTSR